MNNEISCFAPKPKEGEPWDVVIIGSGPAGLTSSIYTTRGAKSTLILAGEKWGGQLMLTTTVDNYPGLPGIQGPELMEKMKNHALMFGAEFVQENVLSVDFSKRPFEISTSNKRYFAKSVIISTGADTRWLGVPGEERLRGKGVSSCASCDAPFFKGKKVAVVGGGDSAMEEALVLTKYVSSVIMIHRRDQFRASAFMQQKVVNESKEGKIKIIWNTEVLETLGDQRLQAVKLRTNTLSENIKNIEEFQGKVLERGEGFIIWELELDGLFVAIGHIPSTNIFKNQIELNEKGYVLKYEKEGFKTATSVEGVFVAGDVHDFHYRQAITAAGFGCMAAMDALKYLDEKSG